MSEHDKDNLSRFIRKALRKPKIEFDESDWNKLERMLDAESAKTSSDSQFRWKSIVAVIAILFFSLGTTYLFISNREQDSFRSATPVQQSTIADNELSNVKNSCTRA